MVKILGFEIRRSNNEIEEKLETLAPPIKDDGAVVVAAGGSFGTYVDLDGTVRTEAELISKYRDLAAQPEIEAAITDIGNEVIIQEEEQEIVTLDLENSDIPEEIKSILLEEFDNVLELIEFNQYAYDIFTRYYIDGRLYYHVLIDKEKSGEGIKEMRFLDPRKIRKIREVTRKKVKNMNVPGTEAISKVKEEYYIYNERGFARANNNPLAQPGTATQGIRISKDSIIHITSGLTNTAGNLVLSHLHKAIKPMNQLRALEDATIIYRISRAPERRIFYIDVGNLPKMKAEQYLRDMMVKYKNKLVYDAQTGEIRDDRKFMTMLEDFWLPRREGGKGTEITTLPGGQNLGELSDVNYFQQKLYKSLNVPYSRMEPESAYTLGRATEISRDEVKFAKFIDRLRLRFSMLFLGILEKQLVLKSIIIPDEWAELKSKIKFRWARDNLFSELKDAEIMTDRLNRLNMIMPFVGRFYSNEWIRRNLLKQDDKEMIEIDNQIEVEKSNPQYAPPVDSMNPMNPMGGGNMYPDQMNQGMPPNGMNGMDQGQQDKPQDQPQAFAKDEEKPNDKNPKRTIN